ncbi:MAG: hypothetical protein CMD79_04100 [Gammaproteobacteria bacterium]|nr:hypothetical protein [Gammaproteobacteria bacterium]
MFLKSDDFLDLTSTNQENLDVILSADEFNLKGIRTQSYKTRIIEEFNNSFDNFLLFVSRKYNLEKDLRLQNFMKPWWLQAVLLKLDREDFCHALLQKGVKNFICEKKIDLQPFLNHTDIKDKIGNDKHFNDFLIALILKKHGIKFSCSNSSKNYGFIKTVFKKTFIERLKSILQNLMLKYVSICSKIFGKNFEIVTDTSNYSRKEIIFGTIKCKLLPLIDLNDIFSSDTHEITEFNFDEINFDEFLYNMFVSNNLIKNFNKYKINNTNVSLAKSYKGFINNLNTRSFITARLKDMNKVKLYPHGGLTNAIWTEEKLSTELSGAKFQNIRINKDEKKYFVNTNSQNVKFDILVTLFGHTKYVSRFRSGMTHHEYITEYIKGMEHFLTNLNKDKYKVKLRFPSDNRFNKKIIDKYSSLGFEFDTNKSINKSLSETRIHIPTYNATLPLYSIINNIPSIFFWNDNHFPLPSIFENILTELKSKNLLFNHSKELVNYLNEVTASEIKENWNTNNDLIKGFGSLIVNN